MKEVYQYLKDCGTYYLATIDGDQARVRPFGTIDEFEGKLYIQTGNVKNVFAQMQANPKIEITAMKNDGSWIRVAATAVRDDRVEAREHMLDAYPSLKGLYAADDGNCEVLYLKDATAVFSSFTAEPRTVTF
ncbi:pyridoxamine 5'-phosphate oxidase family protein [Dehalobacter sp. DCM]|uniref:pyridoxamine 5'-phosphate oxidase family protein n=1 Tax=Dehalobacter sp. DCM TaxID=2907827 RepID=UPI00308169E1|nr:pyridoxamine 5'-phosphate oxidase family protein [Dehalobacter sp. DCM]